MKVHEKRKDETNKKMSSYAWQILLLGVLTSTLFLVVSFNVLM